MSEIKTNFEFPRGDDNVKFMQRLIQDLSKNFKFIQKNIGANSSASYNQNYGLNGNLVTYNFSLGNNSSYSVTVAHGLGMVPSGFVVTDMYTSNSISPSPDDSFLLRRTSWDATNITFSFSILFNNIAPGTTVNGYFNVVVLG